ncbi:MAG: methyltransferase domain-containing protein [Bacteroidetes bacterium]|nr:methyltransferase domain-containing protein [Bacteroidota bacterium]
MLDLTKEYWTSRYTENDTGWDLGEISTPLKEYIDQLTDKSISILIPGAGNSYEAEYLFKNGFKNVTIIDLSEEPLKNIQKRIPDFPKENLIVGDFFEHHNHYDLILEQTFFCAINPSLRQAYAKKMHELLNNKGKLVGVLFNDVLNIDKPPFGGNKEEYISYFNPYFHFKTFDSCYNSIKPRANRELFIHFEKK